jgi:hypothetical protein
MPDGLPAIVTHQIYASRYMNGSVVFSTIVSDETGQFCLIFADISRSDALAGLFSGIKRSVASSEGTERVKSLLQTAKTRLETPPAPTEIRSEGDTRSPAADWVKATALIATLGILILIFVAIGSYLRRVRNVSDERG